MDRLIVTLLACLTLAMPVRAQDVLDWTELTPFPDLVGVAGPFAGVSNDALIVAGGANFPDGRPWDGHSKVWHDAIYVLPSPFGDWIEPNAFLPRPAAYGLAVTWRDAVVCVGGGDRDVHHADAYLLRWSGESIEVEPLPDLPGPVAFGTGALLGDVVHVMGGIDRPDATRCLDTHYALDLAGDRVWRTLAPIPGPARYLATGGAQAGAVYYVGGIQLEAGDDDAPRRILPYERLAHRFDPVSGTWSRIAGLPTAVAAAPGPAVAIGTSGLLVLGGDDGEHAGVDLRDEHPGFAGTIHQYDVFTDAWLVAGSMPRAVGGNSADHPWASVWPPVTTTALWWQERIVVPSGEVRPGVRTQRVQSGTPIRVERSMGVVDGAIIAVYLLALVGLGLWFSKREKTTDDFFVGGRRVPWWAAGMSIFGTQLSAITFLAIPAKTFSTDWLYLIQNLGIIAMAPIVVWFYLPFFRRLEVTSAYEYLERRFGPGLRIFGALSFILFQLARMAIVMFLPALALAAVTGLPIAVCILIMGVLCTIYTVLGGIEAVIWTDVLQVVVLTGGALLALIIIVADVGTAEIGTAIDAGKFRLVDVRWDWTGPAIGVILLGAVFNNLVPYTSDQAVIQRYLTTADEKQAARAVWTGALLSLPASLLFFSVGTALWVFYRAHPERLDPHGPVDQVFASFIVAELPPGLVGLVIAGVFAAAMSSLDSSMNSIATVVTTDFHRRWGTPRSEAFYLRFARMLTLGLGVLGTAGALILSRFEVGSLWDVFLAYIGLLGGTLAGLFALGIGSRRAHARGAAVGVLASVAALVYFKTQTGVSGLTYAAIGMVVCVVAGWVASLLIPGPPAGPGMCWRTLDRSTKP